MLAAFHFLRPEWLFALPLVLLLLALFKAKRRNSGWEDVCEPELLRYQLAHQEHSSSASQHWLKHWLNWTVPLMFCIGIFALAGPAWEKKEQPVFQQDEALVVLLDLSQSMNARDIKPSRLERAKLKLIDILQQKKEGQTALIAFAGDAHTVSPLTIDNKTIINLLPSLDSSIMPLRGSHLADALNTARQLFKNAGFTHGNILLLSDGIDASQQNALETTIRDLRRQGYRFSAIGVGSQAGSPIPMPGRGGFIKDQAGQVVLSKLQPGPLKQLAAIGGGYYAKLSLDDSDFKALLQQTMANSNDLITQDNQLEQWLDAGAYFTLLLIPLALLSFRKGLLSVLLCLSISSFVISEPGYAETPENNTQQQWQALWATPDQQGQELFEAKDYQQAADSFSDQKWKASAYYRDGDFKKALEQYSRSDDADSLYNKANTLANLNKFEDAVKAYEDALKHSDQSSTAVQEKARKNLDYIKKLLEQQKQQQKEQNNSEQGEPSEKSSENQQNKQQNSSEEGSKANESDAEQSQKGDSENADSGSSDKAGNNQDEQSKQPQDDASDSSGEEESSAKKEPSARKESSADEEPSADKEPSAGKEPSTGKDSSAEQTEARTAEESNPTEEQLQQQQDRQNKAAQAQQQAEQDSEKNAQKISQGQASDVLSQLNQEEQQSLKQWLQRIPDNPGELLRIKFRNNTLLKQQRKQRQYEPSDVEYEGKPW